MNEQEEAKDGPVKTDLTKHSADSPADTPVAGNDGAGAPPAAVGTGLDLGPGLQLEPPSTQPVTAAPTITYPTLPERYTLAESTPDAAPSAPSASTGTDARTSTGRSGRAGRSPRIRTVVVGLVLLTISVISLLSLLTDLRVDGGIVGLALLIGAGTALVAGGIAAAAKEARGGPGGAR